MISFYITKSVEHIDKNINAVGNQGFSKKDSVSIAKDASDIARNFIQISAAIIMTFLYLYGIIAVYLYMSVNNIPKINNDGSLSLYFSVAVAAIPYLMIICIISYALLVLSYISWKRVSLRTNTKNKILKFLAIFLAVLAPSHTFTISFFFNNGFAPSIFFAIVVYLLSLSLIAETKISIKKGVIAAAALLIINIIPFPFIIIMIKTTYNEFHSETIFNFNILIAIFYFYFCMLSMSCGLTANTIHELTKYTLKENTIILAAFMLASVYNFADISMSILGHSLPYPVKVTSTRSETIINLDNPVCVLFNGDKMIYLRQAAPRDEQSADGQFVCKPPSKNMPPTVGIKSDTVTSIQKYKPPASPASP